MIFVCTHDNTAHYDLSVDFQLIKSNKRGKNIWKKESFRHLRHIYYIWNNLDKFDIQDDTITIFQNRRYMNVWDIPTGYDCTCTLWRHNPCPIGKQYIMCHDSESLELSKEIINDEEYNSFLELPMHKCSYHNIFSLHVADFQDYCQLLFDTLFEIEKQLPDWNNACYLGERIGGFIIEKYFPKKYIANLIEI